MCVPLPIVRHDVLLLPVQCRSCVAVLLRLIHQDSVNPGRHSGFRLACGAACVAQQVPKMIIYHFQVISNHFQVISSQ